MLGVVLWSDNSDRKAVIWCEDHGELAYFSDCENSPLDGFDLDAGDLVRFDLQQENHLRLAHNPRRVEQGAYPGLADCLQTASHEERHNPQATAPALVGGGADVIPFERLCIERADRERVAV